jgi:hypothetical protein
VRPIRKDSWNGQSQSARQSLARNVTHTIVYRAAVRIHSVIDGSSNLGQA